MSQENVEIVRAAFDAFRADNSIWDTNLWDTGVWDPDIELDCPATLPDIGGVHKGIEAVVEWWREWLAAWEVVEFDYELIDAGEHVVALVDQSMRGRSSGINVPMGKYAHVLTYRDGLIVRWKFYLRQSEALKAVGLEE